MLTPSCLVTSVDAVSPGKPFPVSCVHSTESNKRNILSVSKASDMLVIASQISQNLTLVCAVTNCSTCNLFTALKSSVALSQAVIAAASVVSVALKMTGTHALDPRLPLIDYEVALVVSPVLFVGVSVGRFYDCNTHNLSQWNRTVCLNNRDLNRILLKYYSRKQSPHKHVQTKIQGKKAKITANNTGKAQIK